MNRGGRVGLVGPNGAGKSTLFSLILDEASPDAGKVSLEKSITLGYLPQETASAGEESVLELACGKSHQQVGSGARLEIESKEKRILAGLAFRECVSTGWILDMLKCLKYFANVRFVRSTAANDTSDRVGLVSRGETRRQLVWKLLIFSRWRSTRLSVAAPG